MKFKTPIILASGSPRRKSLLNELGIDFMIKLKDVDENYPAELQREEVAIYLARKKASVYNEEVQSGFTIITADTIVCLDNQILGKPTDEKDAFRMLRLLSGKKHEVITAVCIKNKNEESCFHVTTAVYFKSISDDEINHYISTSKPFDKAGGYGIQDWIGLIAIERIDGSYYNVVGLPVKELYDHLTRTNTFTEL